MFEIIQNDWFNSFFSELKKADEALIVSPFIGKTMVDHLIKKKRNGSTIKIITRFNLNDFRSGASSISAIRSLVENNITIKGIQGLHSKVYIFDERCVILGSANFTTKGFFNNFEYGIKSLDSLTINTSKEYFWNLWAKNPEVLNIQQVDKWEDLLKMAPHQRNSEELPDFGFVPSLQQDRILGRQYFIKIFGKTEHRVDLGYHVKEELERSHCHWALTFSGKKGRPRKYKTGDIVYMARMLHGNDYAIFGKAIALQHIDTRDLASVSDIEQIEWKKDWPVYIRIKDSKFLDTSMRNCPKMSALIDELNFESFYNTSIKYLNGEKDINIKASLRQQADIRITEHAAEWLNNKLLIAENSFGTISKSFLDSLYVGSPSLNEILNDV